MHPFSQQFRSRPSRAAFTLVELLVVIAIIGVLVALLLPAVQQAREAARRMQCGNNLKQLGLAMHTYHDVSQAFPPATSRCADGDGTIDFHANCPGYSMRLLPFIEQDALFDSITWGAPFEGSATVNRLVRDARIDTFHCPSDSEIVTEETSDMYSARLRNYVINMGSTRYLTGTGTHTDDNGLTAEHFPGIGDWRDEWPNGWKANAVKMRDVTDGLSNTLMLGEIITPERVNIWCPLGRIHQTMGTGFTGFYPPNSLLADRMHFGENIVSYSGGKAFSAVNDWMPMSVVGAKSLHPGGAQFALGDGSVRFIPETVDRVLYLNLSARNDGNPIGSF
ncbi:MAG: DUF1559 domain-containing protein [Pirellulaceae bacterium]